ncbi:MAG TPA: Mu transposase C-terminal domain-containing protein [Phycisphaerae bacterium]|nr:Mu transposase C-terminal domain-containing protein [Phycisphaerae bacterium]
MSSLTTQSLGSNPPPAPRGVVWIDVKTAAERMNASERWVLSLCSSKWACRSLARLETPPGGGKPRWVVREDADPALARIKFPEQLPADIRSLTESQRKEYARRVEIYHAWEAACSDAIRSGGTIERATAAFIGRVQAESGVAIDDKTLYAWRKRYRSQGNTGLMDGRWKRKDKHDLEDPMLTLAARLWRNPNRPSVQLCYDMAKDEAIEKGWHVWSLGTVDRYIRRHVNPCVAIYRRAGKKAFTDQAETYIERDYSGLLPNDLWNSDHHEFDVMVQLPGERANLNTGEVKRRHARPWLTVWQDCRSRKIVGWAVYASDPNTDCILLALHRAVKSHGVPKECAVDNGKDFDSFALHGRTKRERHTRIDREIVTGAFALLTIKPHNVEKYHGQSKPCERFFGTLEGRFGKTWPTYCGNKPENRPEGLQDRLDKGQAPTLEEFTAAFAEWVESDHNQKPHTGDGVDGETPAAVFDRLLPEKRTAPEAHLDFLLQKSSRPVKVTQNGVVFDGLRYGKYEPALRPLLGQKVTLRMDPADVSRVTVWMLDGRFVCVAPANQRVPANATREVLNAAIAEKRRDTKAKLAYNEARLRMSDDLTDRVLRAASRRAHEQAQNAAPDPVPPSIRPIRTPIDEHLERAQRALQVPAMRLAAGAEGLDLLQLANDELNLCQRTAQAPSLSLLTALNDEPAGDAFGGEQ